MFICCCNDKTFEKKYNNLLNEIICCCYAIGVLVVRAKLKHMATRLAVGMGLVLDLFGWTMCAVQEWRVH